MTKPARDWLDEDDEIERLPDVLPLPVPTRPPRSIDAQVRNVADGRRKLADLEFVMRMVRQEFEDSNLDITQHINNLKKEVHEGEETLKTMALVRHRETGEVHLAPGVKIRRVIQVDYDSADAIEWCKAHDEAAGCLKLDTAKFGSLAKALSLPFVTKETVSQVTLSRDLDAELKGAAA